MSATLEDAGRVSRPHSMDLAIALENQLGMEDDEVAAAAAVPAPLSAVSPTSARPNSLDAQVLASIVTQLRDSVARLTAERDDLLNHASIYVSREADLKDALQHMTDKFTETQEALNAAREQQASDQENISMLRTKVEESRRGLMKLQTESRRSSVMSTMTLDLGRAGGSAPNGPPSGRRPQFTPLTGAARSGHLRGPSVSDSHLNLDARSTPLTPAMDENGMVMQSGSRSPPKASKRMSGFFGRASPPIVDSNLGAEMGSQELEKIRLELRAARSELEETRAELNEALEAREASETCVGALRSFIAENQLGEGAPAPVLPAVGTPAVPKHETKKSGGWGFKLWRADSSTAVAPAAPLSAVTPTGSISSPTVESPSQPIPRKLTGFFGARTSTEYTPSVTSTTGIHDRSEESSLEEVPEPHSPPPIAPAPSTVLISSADATPPATYKTEDDAADTTVTIAVP